MNTYRRVLPYLKPYKKLVAVSLALMLVTIVVGLALPWPLQILIDNVLGDAPLSPMLDGILGGLADDTYALMLVVVLSGLALSLLGEAFQVLNNFVNTKIEQRMVLDFRSDLLQHAQHLSMAYHDRRRSGSLIYAMNSQASAAGTAVMVIPPLLQSLLTLIGMLWILLMINLQLALLSLAVLPLLYLYITYYATHIQPRVREVKLMEGESLSIIHEAMSMLRVIVAFGREGHEHARFRRQGTEAVDARVKLTVRESLFTLAVNLTTAAGTALVLGFGAHYAIQGNLSPGQLLVVTAYLASVYKPLETISYTFGSLQSTFVSLQLAFALLDTEEEIKDAPGAVDLERAKGAVMFDEVDFSYNRRKATLSGISFEVQPGQLVGIVGPTGAGKTTLVSLIPRFYEPTKGRVLLDGVDVREIKLASLREQVSVVLQEPLLFKGTVADNLRYGRLDCAEEDIVEAAKAANAHDFIVALPQGYDTEVGERGVQLSGGERQRICVARAFLKDAPVLILDEPTSSIDSRTESVILEALERLMVGRTTFMIAHRLSTIRKADLILVLDKGQIVERGTNEELIELGGLYSQLHQMQVGQAREKAARGTAGQAPECPNCGRALKPWLEQHGFSGMVCPPCLTKASAATPVPSANGKAWENGNGHLPAPLCGRCGEEMLLLQTDAFIGHLCAACAVKDQVALGA